MINLDKHKGLHSKRNLIARHGQFENDYKQLKMLINGLIKDGKYNMKFNVINETLAERALKVLPPIKRCGVFHQYWIVE
jgi:hypothetical protein